MSPLRCLVFQVVRKRRKWRSRGKPVLRGLDKIPRPSYSVYTRNRRPGNYEEVDSYESRGI